MNCYKLSQSSDTTYIITNEVDFIKSLPQIDRKIWMRSISENKRQYLAICPFCNNPIIIIGFFNRKSIIKPYGKHYCKSIPGLAQYNQHAYDDCIYAAHTKVWDTSRRRQIQDPMSLKVYKLVKSQLDRIFYILSQDTDILFSLNQVEKILKSYVSAQGYTFMSSYPNNLPWTFAYIAQGLSLYGSKIKKYSELAIKLKEYNFITLKEYKEYYVVLTNNTFKFITFEFRNLQLVDNNLALDFQIRCSDKNHQNLIILYNKKLDINEARFQNLIKKERNEKFEKIWNSYLDIISKVCCK